MPTCHVRNPGTGEHLGEVPQFTPEDVDHVAESAVRGQRAMAAVPAHQRAARLTKVAALLDAHTPELAGLLAAENGKPLAQTSDELAAAARIFRGFAGEATRLFGRQIPLDAVPGLERHLAVTLTSRSARSPPSSRSTTPSSCTPTRPPPRSPPATPSSSRRRCAAP